MTTSQHTVTIAEVEAIYQYELTRGKSARDVFLGVRTKVHALLQDQLPAPTPAEVATLTKPAVQIAGASSVPDTHRSFELRRNGQHMGHVAALSDQHVLEAAEKFEASMRAAGRIDPSEAATPATFDVTENVYDEHHHAHQVAHHNELWAEADRLLDAAGITESGHR